MVDKAVVYKQYTVQFLKFSVFHVLEAVLRKTVSVINSRNKCQRRTSSMPIFYLQIETLIAWLINMQQLLYNVDDIRKKFYTSHTFKHKTCFGNTERRTPEINYSINKHFYRKSSC